MGKARIVVALGGNAILQPKQKGTAQEQMENVRHTCRQIAKMIKAGYEVVITHGNGPQVGAIMIQNELGSSQVPAMPMDVCGAESQGMIGYMISQNLRNAFLEEGIQKEVACVVTQVEVDPSDPSFKNPTKPVGPFYTEEEARRRMEATGEVWVEDAGRGWRRVVPSPQPKAIVEKEVIKAMVEGGVVVIASGGGGIPVVRDESGKLHGVEAVIDKDLAGEKLAETVGADILLILTDVPKVAINFRQPNEKWLDVVDVPTMRALQREGHFKSGSMGPKVEAVLRFVEWGGKKGIIASLNEALEALEGKAGTHVVPKEG